MKRTNTSLFPKLLTFLALAVAAFTSSAAEPPKLGDAAPDFALNTLDGKTVTLSAETANQPVVLVVLRGWPGYRTCVIRQTIAMNLACGFHILHPKLTVKRSRE
jgi:hypothetical protein